MLVWGYNRIMANTNTTKKQHYLPEFYLKQFLNSQKLLNVYDKKNNRILKPFAPGGVGYEHFYYAVQTGVHDEISQHVESWLHAHEDIISEQLPGIIETIHSQRQINEDQKYILATLMCLLWLRTPSMRNSLNQMHEDLIKQIQQFNPERSVDNYIKKTGVAMTINQRAELIETIKQGKYKIHFSNIAHLRFMTQELGFNDQGFTNLFYGHKWKMYLAKGKKRFITTDSPVIEWCPPPESFFGPTFLDRKKYFSLTPEIFIELLPPHGSAKINRKTIYEQEDSIVQKFNLFLVTRGSANFAYSNNVSALNEIVLSKTNIGQLEREVYMEYDHPWDLYKRDILNP